MSRVLQIVEKILCEKNNIDVLEGEINELIENSDKPSFTVPVGRLFKAYKDEKYVDLCGHLRQCLIYYKNPVKVSERLYEILFRYKDRFGFTFSQRDNKYSVNTVNKIMTNIPDLKSSYTFRSRRVKYPSISDGRMYRYYGYRTYTSLAQKLLNYLIANLSDNETLLACLPTGGGKSMSWQLPAISSMYQGTIIVVVPTVALAMDHEKTSRNFYSKVFGVESYPRAYTSDLKADEKEKVLEELKNGKLPVLYISPEALLRKEFKNSVFHAAEDGNISSLIIDEVHLVVSWGMKFRPEFQLLSAFRKQLMEICKIKTVLLSATLTPADTEVLRNIFASDQFIEFRADQLRIEPEYYAYESKTDNGRRKIISEIIDQAPRPIILYVMTPDQGTEYLEMFREKGYQNIQTFSGRTTNELRKRIINEWNQDKIDIMIATSAFGMGVDKSDVRTIITGYIPESISRYYQEVGRAGRDGYSTLNYFVYNKKMDYSMVESIKSNIISVELLIARWKELLHKSERITADEVWIDVNIPPEHLRFSVTGAKNAGWNKDIILLLFRSGLIDILDYEIKGARDYRIHIKLININVLENMDSLSAYIEPLRDLEKERIDQDLNNVKELIKKDECYSNYFENEFPHVEGSCSGCPYCRENNLDIFADDNRIEIISEYEGLQARQEYYSKKLGLALNNNIMISYTTDFNRERCVEFLVKEDVRVIVGEEVGFEILEQLRFYDQYKYIILSIDEIEEIELKWIRGVCALIYPNNSSTRERYYYFSRRYMNYDDENKIIHVTDNDTYINSESKMLNELVDKNILVNSLLEDDLYENS